MISLFLSWIGRKESPDERAQQSLYGVNLTNAMQEDIPTFTCLYILHIKGKSNLKGIFKAMLKLKMIMKCLKKVKNLWVTGFTVLIFPDRLY